MQAKTRTNQGGSVINFLIVGVLLAAIALGAIYFAQQRSKNGVDQPGEPVATSPSTSPQASSQTTPSSSPSPSTQPSATPSPSTTPDAVPPTGMPATGPADDLVFVSLPLVLLMSMSIAYYRSRRATS